MMSLFLCLSHVYCSSLRARFQRLYWVPYVTPYLGKTTETGHFTYSMKPYLRSYLIYVSPLSKDQVWSDRPPFQNS